MRDFKRLVSFFIFLFILIFCLAACRGTQVSATVETKTRDSISLREIKSVGYENIPTARVFVKIPVRDIADLPAGAGYSEKNGRAGVDIIRQNDTIYVSAVCDSLLRRIEYYEMSLQKTRENSETRLKIERKNSVQTAFKWCLIGVLTGSGITILVRKLLKR
jgi:hypothetical protein